MDRSTVQGVVVSALILSSRDQANLERAHNALLSPFSGSTVDDWRSRVVRNLRELLGADKATFMLPGNGAQLMYSEEINPSVIRQYPGLVAPVYDRFQLRERELKLGVWTRASLFGPHIEQLYRSDYYNEYCVPNGFYDSLALTVALDGSDEVATIFLHHDRPTGRKFGNRGVQLLRLLYPAFRAAVGTRYRFAAYREDLARMVDTLGEGVLLADRQGRVVYQNRALVQTLGADAEGERLRGELQQAARHLARLSSGPRAPGAQVVSAPVVRKLRTATASYELRGVYVGPELFGPSTAVMLTLERCLSGWPGEEALRGRFGLTPREAEVALLLAGRRSNREIAEQLSISPHTAHHHTESVFQKLGVHSRAEVGRRLQPSSS
jgi:DNA-binding CsgD family transcriptional regulator/PAS domain-containing protein